MIRDDLFAGLARSKVADTPVALVTIDPAETPADASAARNGVLDRYPGARVVALTGSWIRLSTLLSPRSAVALT